MKYAAVCATLIPVIGTYNLRHSCHCEVFCIANAIFQHKRTEKGSVWQGTLAFQKLRKHSMKNGSFFTHRQFSIKTGYY